jgi:hypothetical protein
MVKQGGGFSVSRKRDAETRRGTRRHGGGHRDTEGDTETQRDAEILRGTRRHGGGHRDTEGDTETQRDAEILRDFSASQRFPPCLRVFLRVFLCVSVLS